MALDGTDPNIALAAGNIPGAFQQGYAGAGQNLNQMLAMQLRMQQLRQVQQSENALRQLYSNPGNLDESGRPTTNAMGELMRADPRAGLQLQGQLAQLDQRKALAEAGQLKVTQEHKKTAYGIGVAALEAYDDTLQKTGNERAARQKMEEVRSQMLDASVADGTLDKRMAQAFPPSDPVRYRALKSAYEAQNTKPMSAYQAQELGIQRGRLGLEAEKFQTETKAKEDALAETAQHHRTTEDISRSKSGNEKLSPSKEIAIVDKDGAVVDRFAARESSKGPGWVRSDTGKPVEVPPGGKIDVGQAAGAVIGSRENVYIGRILEGGITATADLENIAKMPVGVTSGIFGGRKQGPGLVDATKEVLANKLTTRDVQIYNSANTGIQRALAVIESAGLAPSGAFTEQFQGLTLKEGDDQMARLYKMANARQIVENGMAVIAANPRVAPEQKKLATTFLDRVRAAIPWTTSDVIKLQTSDDPNATLHNLGVGKTGKGEKTEGAPEKPKAAAKTGSLDVTEDEYKKLPSGAAYTVPGDSTVRYKQ